MLRVDKMSGKMLMSHQLRSMMCISRQGYQTPIGLGLRINLLIEGGVQVCGVMNFPTNKAQHCVLMLDQTGKIRELTKIAEAYFEKGQNMVKYNKSFGLVLEVKIKFSLKKLKISIFLKFSQIFVFSVINF